MPIRHGVNENVKIIATPKYINPALFATLIRFKKIPFCKDVQSGVAEPNVQGGAFAHPILGLKVNKMMVLRT